MLQKDAKLGNTASQLDLHILLDLLPCLHRFYLVHNNCTPISDGFKEDAGHLGYGKDSCSRFLDPLELEEGLNIEMLKRFDNTAHLVLTGDLGDIAADSLSLSLSIHNWLSHWCRCCQNRVNFAQRLLGRA